MTARPFTSLFNIGDFQVARIYETEMILSVEDWFPGLTAELIEPHKRLLKAGRYDDSTGRFPLPVCSWVLRHGRRTILIDTCIGNCKNRLGLAEAHHLHTPYLDLLAASGIVPEEVDVVLCTHLHFDHVGWNTRLSNGKWNPTFRNAVYIWSTLDQADALRSATAIDTPAFLRNVYADSIHPIIEAGQALPIHGEHAVQDGVYIRPAPGHSPGHVRIEVKSRGELGIFCGDMLHAPLQVPLWRFSSRACADPAQATLSRLQLLTDCDENGALLIPTHFPYPYVCRVRRVDGKFDARPGWR